MAFETGSATNGPDLISKLFTFAVANGWTQDELAATISGNLRKSSFHRNNIYAQFQYDNSSPSVFSLYQSLGFTGGNSPGAHPNDSGNGYNGPMAWTTVLGDDERNITFGTGPFPSYFFFEQDFYLHAVVEISTDVFRHFGFGTLLKSGTWTGGEYVYGHFKQTNSAISQSDTVLLDGLFTSTSGTDEQLAATLHCEGLPGQGGSSKWGNVWGRFAGDPLTDTAGVQRVTVLGGYRGGFVASQFGNFFGGPTSGFIPTYPIACSYHDNSLARSRFLGFMPDVRGINMKLFAPKQTVVIGSDTWYVFPSSQKTAVSGTNRSYNQGIAYRRDNG